MTAIDNTHAHSLPVAEGLLSRIAQMLHMTREERARRALYRRTVRELSALSNRDLADLGISRSAIRSLAHEAAYNA